jgi:hypothetical protein
MQLHYWDGKARASVWMATLVACLIMAAFVRYADAQESALSFKECLDKQKELRDESKSFGDRAWAAVGLLQGAKFFSEESNALYEKASELGKAADAVHCVMQLGSTPVTDAEKLKQFDDMDNILRDKAILDPNIRDFVNDRFKQIDEVNEATFKLLGDTALAIRDNLSLSVESNSNLDTLGDSHTLGNSSSLGNYSAALEQDIQA